MVAGGVGVVESAATLMKAAAVVAVVEAAAAAAFCSFSSLPFSLSLSFLHSFALSCRRRLMPPPPSVE